MSGLLNLTGVVETEQEEADDHYVVQINLLFPIPEISRKGACYDRCDSNGGRDAERGDFERWLRW